MKKICVFTGTRAEYGQLVPLLRLLDVDDGIHLQILVSGTHLSPEFGLTYTDIEDDGFAIDEKVAILGDGNTPADVCESMGKGLAGYGEALVRLNPDMLIIAGDRYEALAIAAAATVCSIPIAHLHGGETTLGSLDEYYRHAITKLSLLHFTATEDYRQRVIQLGESPDRVFNVGALAVEKILGTKLLSKDALERDLGFKMGDACLLVTFHPATMEQASPEVQMQQLLVALKGYRVIFTKSNADAGGQTINRMIDNYVSTKPEDTASFTSLGHLRYLSAMSYAGAVVGNSSSGITEAPSMKTPTVNIGSRQNGRVRAISILDCSINTNHIRTAIHKALSPEFQHLVQSASNPYSQEGTAQSILKIITEYKLESGLYKRFHDL